MTLTDKENEALARFAGWERCDPSAYQFDTYYHPDGRSRQGPPDMTTPEAMVELLEFCREKGLCLDLRMRPDWYAVELVVPCMGRLTPAGAKTPGEAVCKAVLACLAEKEGG